MELREKQKGKAELFCLFLTCTLWHEEISHDSPLIVFGSGNKNFLDTTRKWKTHGCRQKNNFVVGQETGIFSQMIFHGKKLPCYCPAPSD